MSLIFETQCLKKIRWRTKETNSPCRILASTFKCMHPHIAMNIDTCVHTGTCVFFLSNIKNTPNSNMHFLTSVYQKNKDKIKTFTLLYFHNMFSVCLESFHYARKLFPKDQTYGVNVESTSKFPLKIMQSVKSQSSFQLYGCSLPTRFKWK